MLAELNKNRKNCIKFHKRSKKKKNNIRIVRRRWCKFNKFKSVQNNKCGSSSRWILKKTRFIINHTINNSQMADSNDYLVVSLTTYMNVSVQSPGSNSIHHTFTWWDQKSAASTSLQRSKALHKPSTMSKKICIRVGYGFL